MHTCVHDWIAQWEVGLSLLYGIVSAGDVACGKWIGGSKQDLTVSILSIPASFYGKKKNRIVVTLKLMTQTRERQLLHLSVSFFYSLIYWYN